MGDQVKGVGSNPRVDGHALGGRAVEDGRHAVECLVSSV